MSFTAIDSSTLSTPRSAGITSAGSRISKDMFILRSPSNPLWRRWCRSADVAPARAETGIVPRSNDRYRGVLGRLTVVFMNEVDMSQRGIAAGGLVEVESLAEDGHPRVLREFTAPFVQHSAPLYRHLLLARTGQGMDSAGVQVGSK